MAQERPDQPTSPEARYPTGWSILQGLQRHMREECTAFHGEQGEDLFRSLYLTEKDGCIPSHLLGEDLMVDIISMYYDVFDAVRKEIQRRLKPVEILWVYVQPDYYDTTFALLVTDSRVLFVEASKAWHFWWADEEEMAKELETWYQAAAKALSEPPSPRLEFATAAALEILLEEVERKLPERQAGEQLETERLRFAVSTLKAWLRERGIVPPEQRQAIENGGDAPALG